MISGFDANKSDSEQPADVKAAGLPPQPPTEKAAAKQSHLISKVLSPAVSLWLRSQVEQVKELQVNIGGGDRQLLSGHIPCVSISANAAIYQGLHLGEVRLTGSNIRINIGQVIKGKPLRLLEPIPVAGELRLPETDLNASLQAPLLGNAVNDFVLPLLPLKDRQGCSLQNCQIKIEADQLILSADLVGSTGPKMPFTLCTGLVVCEGHKLQFVNPKIKTATDSEEIKLEDLTLDLGSQVDIQELSLNAGLLVCRGGIRVMP